ncbi:uncharacterized protein [Apostichopus japonicus]|uniref:uncharacterized protein n=1 Tax=Stichopus japonicus TaxID=307972 RepID=UPI003AB379A4
MSTSLSQWCSINAASSGIKDAHFREVGDTSPVQYFPFGSKVGIYCVKKTSSKTNITIYDKGFIHIVVNSVLQDRFSDTYQFQVINSTTCLFTINNLTRQLNDTTFTSLSDLQRNARIRGFNPINDVNPFCSSSYPSRFIFEDSVQSDIEMNCTSEEGDPPVMMSTYIKDGDEINDVTSISTRTVSSYPHRSKTLSFSSYFNSSFNNIVFVCNVSQQLPAPYQNYQGSCSFGTILFLPLFSVTATPSNVNFSDVRNEIFRCTSNVSEVNLTWTNIPSHWIYDINEGDTYIELTVLDTGRGVYSGDIQCIGYYGDRNITSEIEISATDNQGRVIAVILVVMVIFLCFIFLIVVMVYKYRLNVPYCKRNQVNVTDGENSSKNNANDRNTSMNDDIVPPIESQTERSNALDVPGMIANTVYETYTGKDDQNETSPVTEKAKMGKRKGKEIEMIESEIYEIQSVPGEVNSTSIPEAVNPLYDSISPQCKKGNCN